MQFFSGEMAASMTDRELLVAMIAQGLASNPDLDMRPESFADRAVRYADAIVRDMNERDETDSESKAAYDSLR